MEKNNTAVLPEGQSLFTPSRNPYSILPPFIKAWVITDLVFSGLWCACAVVLILGIILMPYSWMMMPQLVFAVLAGGIGLGANIAMLSRKPGGLIFARLLLCITLLHLVWHGFLVWGLWLLFSPHLAWQVVSLSVGSFLFLVRAALLVFYWITVVKAGRYFANRRHFIGF